MSNHITVVGTIATAPHEIGAGTPTSLCTFRLASNERRYNREKGEWVDGPTNWFTINAFRNLGVHAQRSFGVGDRIIATGRLRVRRWEKDERSGTAVEVDADALGHDLRWGVSRFEKTAGRASRDTDGDGEAGGGDEAGRGGDGEASRSGFEEPSAGVGGFISVEPPTGLPAENPVDTAIRSTA